MLASVATLMGCFCRFRIRIPYLSGPADVSLFWKLRSADVTLDQRLGMGCSEHADHYRTGPRAGFDGIAEKFGTAFLPMRASNREQHKIPPRPPLAPSDRPGCAGRKLKEPGHHRDENYNREEAGGFAAGQ